MQCFYSKDSGESLGYVFSQNLAVLLFFDVSKRDSAKMLMSLETHDPELTRKVDVLKFALLYCKDEQDNFLLLWDYFEQHLSGEYVKPYAAKQSKTPEVLRQPDYSDFICFLMLVLSLQPTQTSLYLYYCWFHQPKIQPTEKELLDDINKIWGKTKARKSKVEKFKKAAEKSFTFVDWRRFNAQRFQLIDMKIGAPWSLPFQLMLRGVRKKFLGNAFWKRNCQHYTDIMGSVDAIHAAMKRLEDQKFEGSVEYLHRFGERKSARKQMRKFLRVAKDFIDMPTEDNDLLGGSGRGVFTFLYDVMKDALKAGGNAILHRSAKILPSLDTTRSGPQGPQGFRKGGTAAAARTNAADTAGSAGDDDGVEVVVPVPLEVRYKESLAVSTDSLFEKSAFRLAESRSLIRSCIDECVPCDQIPLPEFLAVSKPLSNQTSQHPAETVDEGEEEDEEEEGGEDDEEHDADAGSPTDKGEDERDEELDHKEVAEADSPATDAHHNG